MCDTPFRPSHFAPVVTSGRPNVGLLARRTGIDLNTLSTRLGKLRDEGLLFNNRQGKEVWYEAAPAHVRCQRTETETTLKITARTTGIAVTIHIPATPTPRDSI